MAGSEHTVDMRMQTVQYLRVNILVGVTGKG